MVLTSQTVASTIRAHFRLGSNSKQDWARTKRQAYDLFSRVLNKETNVPPRLPAHAYLHGVIRNPESSTQGKYRYVVDMVKAGVKIHPKTFLHLVQPLIETADPDEPTDGLSEKYSIAFKLLVLAHTDNISHSLGLYHDLVKRYLEREEYDSAVVVFCLLLSVSGTPQRGDIKAIIDSYGPVKTKVFFTVSPEVAQQTITAVQSMIFRHLLDCLMIIGELHGTGIAFLNEKDFIRLLAPRIQEVFQAIIRLADLVRNSTIPSSTLQPLLFPLLRIHLPETLQTGIGASVTYSAGTVIESIITAQVSSSARTGSSTDEAVQLEESVAQPASTAKSSKLKGSQRGKRKKRGNVDETQEG